MTRTCNIAKNIKKASTIKATMYEKAAKLNAIVTLCILYTHAHDFCTIHVIHDAVCSTIDLHAPAWRAGVTRWGKFSRKPVPNLGISNLK